MYRLLPVFLLIVCSSFRVNAADASASGKKHEQFFIIDSWLSGFVYGFFSDSTQRFRHGWQRANHTAFNDIKIWGGLFVSDRNKRFGGRLAETLSRVSYQAIQSSAGFVYSHFENTFAGNAAEVRYLYGSTVIVGRHDLLFGIGGPAVTLGSYVIADENIAASADNSVFQHEYGHYLQSQRMGFAYLGRVGIPSLRSQHGPYKENYPSHDYHPAEQDANRRGFLYFNREIAGFQDDSTYMWNKETGNLGWDFRHNPLWKMGTEMKIGKRTIWYVDYRNELQVAELDSLRVRARWYDYTFLIVSGFYNAYHYNN